MQIRQRAASIERVVVGLASLLYGGAVLGEDVSASDSLLCYGLSAARCETGAACESIEPWRLNLPDFVKLDLRSKLLHTTGANPDPRETPLQNVERANGTIVIQGTQGDRAFSWLITETNGEGTLSIAGHGQGVTVFTVCTAVDKL